MADRWRLDNSTGLIWADDTVVAKGVWKGDELVAAANASERLGAALFGLVGRAAMEEFESVAHISNDEEWDLTVTAGAMREAIDALAAISEQEAREGQTNSPRG